MNHNLSVKLCTVIELDYVEKEKLHLKNNSIYSKPEGSFHVAKCRGEHCLIFPPQKNFHRQGCKNAGTKGLRILIRAIFA